MSAWPEWLPTAALESVDSPVDGVSSLDVVGGEDVPVDVLHEGDSGVPKALETILGRTPTDNASVTFVWRRSCKRMGRTPVRCTRRLNSFVSPPGARADQAHR